MPRVFRGFIGRTMKRELAVAMVIMLFALAWFAMKGDDAAIITAKGSLITALAWPVISYAALAFGMEWVSKQTDWGQTSTTTKAGMDE